MTNPKIDQAVTIALETIHDAHPGLLTMTEVAKKVGAHTDVTTSTARNRLRTACEAGKLAELTPWSARFIVRLPIPGAHLFGPFYIAREVFSQQRNNVRLVITTDGAKHSPSSYGPGRTTYLADPEQLNEYVQTLIKEKEAREEAERQAQRDETKLQRKEITRRFGGLQRHLRILRLLGVGRVGDHFSAVRARASLDRDHDEKRAPEDRPAEVDVTVYGDENVALLHAVLEAGLAAYIAEKPLAVCKNCDGRILRTKDDRDDFWWHIETADVACGKDTETKAEPTKED